jgi:hypothetical protein
MNIGRDAARSGVKELRQHTLERTIAEQVLSTALITKFLEQNVSDDEETWELLVEKARAWNEDVTEQDVFAKVWEAVEALLGTWVKKL